MTDFVADVEVRRRAHICVKHRLIKNGNEVSGIYVINPLNAELNPICHLLTLLGVHIIFHVSRMRVKLEKISKRRVNP